MINGDEMHNEDSGESITGCWMGVVTLMSIAALAMSIIALAIAGC